MSAHVSASRQFPAHFPKLAKTAGTIGGAHLTVYNGVSLRPDHEIARGCEQSSGVG